MRYLLALLSFLQLNSSPFASIVHQFVQHYSELIRGYLEKIARWQTIFQDEQYIISQQPLQLSPHGTGIVSEYMRSVCEVIQTSGGFVIGRAKADPDHNGRSERVFHAQMRFEHTLPHETSAGDLTNAPTGSRRVVMDFTHGLMGSNPFFDLNEEPVGDHPFVDPDGNPLKQVHIEVNSFRGDTWRDIKMYASFPTKWNRPKEEQSASQHIKYTLKEAILTVSKLYIRNENPAMSDAYATHLLDTIDSFIPQSSLQLPEH